VRARDRCRTLGGHLLDVDTALAAEHHQRQPRVAVEDRAQVVLVVDLDRWRHQHAPHAQSLDAHPEEGGRGRRGLLRGARQLDAARLPAPAGVHLGLDRHGAAQRLGRLAGLLRAARDAARGHRDTVRAKDLLGLVFVDVHVCLRAL
jgi:hypothetical protein